MPPTMLAKTGRRRVRRVSPLVLPIPTGDAHSTPICALCLLVLLIIRALDSYLRAVLMLNPILLSAKRKLPPMLDLVSP